MGSLTSRLIVSLIDKVSGPSKGVSASLKAVASAEKALGANAKGADGLAASLSRTSRQAERLKAATAKGLSWGDGFQRNIEKLKLTSRELDHVHRDFARLQTAFRGMRASVAMDALDKWRSRTIANINAVRKAEADFQRHQDRLSRGFRGGARTALGAIGAGSGSYAAYRVGRAGISASATSQRESARDYLAGLSPANSARIAREALGSSTRYNSVDASTMHERLRDTSMSMRSVDKAVELADTIAQGTVVLQSLKGKEQAIEEGRKFFSALDTLGKNIDPKEVRSLFDGYIKALGVEGADMNLGGVLTMARQSRSAGGSLSNRFMMLTGSALQRDMGDSQVGTALASTQSQVIGGQATKKSKEAQKRFGLRDKRGKFLNAKMMMEDPDLYAWGPLKDALKKHGVDTNDNVAVSAALSQLFSNRTVKDIFTKLIQQEEQYRAKGSADVGGYESAPGLKAAGELGRRDPFVALEGLQAQLRNFATQAPFMDTAAGALTRLSAAIGNFTKSFSEDDTAGKIGKGIVLGAGGAAGAYGGVLALRGIYQWFTGGAGALTQSAALLDGSAAALTAAAAKLAGGSVAADVLGAKKPAGKSLFSKIPGGLKTAGGVVLGLISAPLVLGVATGLGAEYANEKQGITRDNTRERHRKQREKYNWWGKYIGSQEGETSQIDQKPQYGRDFTLGSQGGFDKSASVVPPTGIKKMTAWNSKHVAPGPFGQESQIIPNVTEAASAGETTAEAFRTVLGDALPKQWPHGADPAQFLDQSGPAGSAGAKTAEAFKSNFETELRAVDQVIQQAMQRWGAMLGSFRASPSITPSISQPTGGSGAAPAGGQKLGSLENLSAKQQTAQADYGFRTV